MLNREHGQFSPSDTGCDVSIGCSPGRVWETGAHCRQYVLYIHSPHGVHLVGEKAGYEPQGPPVSTSLMPRLCLRASRSTRRVKMKSASSRSVKPQSAKRKSTSVKSKTDWARLKATGSAAKPTPEHP